MRDLDHDLREMFQLHEADVGGVAFAPQGLRRRVRRRQQRTILTASLVLAALVVGGLGIRASIGDRRQPVVVPPSPPLSMTLQGFGVGFSSDGTRLLTRSMTVNRRGFIYDPHAGTVLQTVHGPARGDLVQAFAPDGETFAAAGYNPVTTFIKDARTGRTAWKLRKVCCLGAFSPDGRFLAAPCCGVGSRVYDLATGRSVAQFPVWGVTSFSPDSQRLVISVGRDAPGHVVGYVWGMQGERPAKPELTLHGPGEANVAMASVAWSPDGSMIVLVAHQAAGGVVMVFDAGTGEREFTIQPANSAVSVAFTPDSSVIAVGSTRGRVTLWKVSEPTAPILSFRAHQTQVAAIAFSPDGRQLMTAAWNENETKVWDLASLSSAS